MRALSTVLLLIVTAVASGHPQDGPDVDVRVQIEDDAVVMSLAFNLAYLDEYGLAPREIASEVHPIEADAIQALLLEFLGERNTVFVDGVDVGPVLRSFDMPEADRSLLPLFPGFGMRALTRVLMVVEYPLLNPPANVTLTWGSFPSDYVLSTPDDPRTIVVVMQMWAGGVSWVQDLSETDPSYTWLAADQSAQGRMLDVPAVPVRQPVHAMIPAVSIGLIAAWCLFAGVIVLRNQAPGRWTVALALAPIFIIGAVVSRDAGLLRGPLLSNQWPQLTDEEAEAIFVPLHTNIYRAFDYTQEEDVYDALSQSVTGDLLDNLYADIYASLEMQLEDGAAVSRVQSVDHLRTSFADATPPEAEAKQFTAESTWQVTGAVWHWGHSHTRTNEYKARYTIAGTDGGWRIVETELLEQSRIDAVPGDPNGIFRPGMDL